MGALGTSWRDRQGCYIYRNGRLVVAGGWLRLRKQWKRDVATQLARVRVDFSNVLDHEWKINVMKSTATPPAALRGRLQKLAKRVRRESEAVQVSRFKRVGPAPNRSAAVEAAQPVWMFRQNEGHSFTLNRHHPLVRSLYEMGPHARAVVRVVESSLPIAAIYEEVNRRFEEDGALHTQDPEELVEELHAWLVHQVSEGVALKEEVSRLKRTQPFDAMPGIVDSTAERVATESGLEFTGDEGDD